MKVFEVREKNKMEIYIVLLSLLLLFLLLFFQEMRLVSNFFLLCVGGQVLNTNVLFFNCRE